MTGVRRILSPEEHATFERTDDGGGVVALRMPEWRSAGSLSLSWLPEFDDTLVDVDVRGDRNGFLLGPNGMEDMPRGLASLTMGVGDLQALHERVGQLLEFIHTGLRDGKEES